MTSRGARVPPAATCRQALPRRSPAHAPRPRPGSLGFPSGDSTAARAPGRPARPTRPPPRPLPAPPPSRQGWGARAPGAPSGPRRSPRSLRATGCPEGLGGPQRPAPTSQRGPRGPRVSPGGRPGGRCSGPLCEPLGFSGPGQPRLDSRVVAGVRGLPRPTMSPGHLVWEEVSLERWVPPPALPGQVGLPAPHGCGASVGSGMFPATVALRGPWPGRGLVVEWPLVWAEAGGGSHPTTGRAEAFSAPHSFQRPSPESLTRPQLGEDRCGCGEPHLRAQVTPESCVLHCPAPSSGCEPPTPRLA